jgi:glycosyltransferase involved in cell wall biosynthesis
VEQIIIDCFTRESIFTPNWFIARDVSKYLKLGIQSHILWGDDHINHDILILRSKYYNTHGTVAVVVYYQMKITFVCEKLNLSGGGSNFSLDIICQKLSKKGHDVSVLTMSPGSNSVPGQKEYQIIKPTCSKFGTRLGKLENVYQSLRKYTDITDIFHIFTPMYLPAGGYYNKEGTTPVIGQLNRYSLFCVNFNVMDGNCHKNCNIKAKFQHQDTNILKKVAKIPFYASRTHIEPQYASSLDQYFAISPAVKQIYSDIGLPDEDISLIPEFCDPVFGTKPNLQSPNSDESSLNILYVGHLKRYKGVDILIRAIAKTSETQATIIGDGKQKDELLSITSKLGIENRVQFKGRVSHDKLPSEYAKANVFVHPARFPEPFGRTVLESLQCGTPAIVSNIGAPPWIIDDAGMTFHPDDEGHLARILTKLRDNPENISKLENKCQLQVDRFQSEAIIENIEMEYRKLLD